MKPALEVINLSIGYQQNTIASDLNFRLMPGEMVCLIGANGCGKSTLLKTIAGMIPEVEGDMTLLGIQSSEYTPQERAKKLSMVLTDKPDTVNLSVYELVSLGRSPYTGWYGKLNAFDHDKVCMAMEQTNVLHLQNTLVKRLSDGQKQRVMIAKCLAQDTAILLLDEPTAHLDLPNRVAILQLLHELAASTQKSIILSTHELDLALQISDQIWLFDQNKKLSCDIPEALILNESISKTFGSELIRFSIDNGKFELNRKLNKKVQLIGNGNKRYWTERALNRMGYIIDESAEIKIKTNNFWLIEHHNQTLQFDNLSDFSNYISTLH